MRDNRCLWMGFECREVAVNNDVNERTAVAAARRKLIRGVFAAPAALTLCSGSVYAAASNQQCLAGAVANPVDAPLDTTTWVRVEVMSLGDGDKYSTWVYGHDLKFIRASDTPPPYLSESQWQCLSANSGSGYVAKQVYESDKMPVIPKRTGQYVAVRVDADGKIIGVQGIETGGTAIAASCWASITVLA